MGYIGFYRLTWEPNYHGDHCLLWEKCIPHSKQLTHKQNFVTQATGVTNFLCLFVCLFNHSNIKHRERDSKLLTIYRNWITSKNHLQFPHFPSRWRNRRTCTHLLLQEHQNRNQLLNNHRKRMLDSTRKQYPMSKSKGEVQQDDRRGAIVVKIKSQTCREAWRAQQTLVCTRTEGQEQ